MSRASSEALHQLSGDPLTIYLSTVRLLRYEGSLNLSRWTYLIPESQNKDSGIGLAFVILRQALSKGWDS
ncbi:hypothetical protein Ciccas_012840 [Cichlidogyrus casuarinus]|uniref:Uncharacterized protein n=1 Tax=Cichlidogyrus casuarinus TaxID=1844966 RepID=A0ABD2PNI2_9PLAT